MSSTIFFLLYYYLLGLVEEGTYSLSFGWSEWTLALGEYDEGNRTRTRSRLVLKKAATCESCYIETLEEEIEISKVEYKTLNNAVKNIAFKKPVTSSSVADGFSSAGPSALVDGITNGNFYQSPCMHTGFEKRPWVTIDLGDNHVVEEIIVFNRVDCCSSRANNLTATVGHRQDGKNPLCGIKPKIGKVARYHCENLNGRYVHLYIPGSQYLHLCEVQVMGSEASKVNIALGKNVTASSFFPSQPLERVVDGNIKEIFETKGCVDRFPWIMIDLGNKSRIHKVRLYRFEKDVKYLQNSVATVGMKYGMKWCGVALMEHFIVDGDIAFYEVVCERSLVGNLVKVQLETTEWISVSEIETYGVFI